MRRSVSLPKRSYLFVPTLIQLYSEDVPAYQKTNCIGQGFQKLEVEQTHATETIPRRMRRWQSRSFTIKYELRPTHKRVRAINPLKGRGVNWLHTFCNPGLTYIYNF